MQLASLFRAGLELRPLTALEPCSPPRFVPCLENGTDVLTWSRGPGAAHRSPVPASDTLSPRPPVSPVLLPTSVVAWLVLGALVIFIVPAGLGTLEPWSLAGASGRCDPLQITRGVGCVGAPVGWGWGAFHQSPVPRTRRGRPLAALAASATDAGRCLRDGGEHPTLISPNNPLQTPQSSPTGMLAVTRTQF